MKRILSLTAAGAAFFSSAAVAAEPIRLPVGGQTTIELPENVTTGYSWAIDAGASRNLGSLSIADRGGQPGAARLVPVYRRPWEKSFARRQSYAITVTP